MCLRDCSGVLFESRTLCAGRAFHRGDTVRVLAGPIVQEPTRTSIEVGPGRHIEDEWGQV